MAYSARIRFAGVLAACAIFLGGAAAHAQASKQLPTDIPRVILIGDSWTGFLWAFRTFQQVLPEYFPDENYIEIGSRTAVMGAKVSEFLDPDRDLLEVITEELTNYPTVDVVVMTLGGNDMLRGAVLDPSHQGPSTRWNCTNTTALNDQVIDAIARDIEEVIDHVLAIRPDIRVVLPSYTFGGNNPRGGCLPEDGQMAFVELGFHKRAIAAANPRVDFVNNYGLMQHLYGLDSAENPDNVEPPVVIAPGVLPAPGNYPTYDPMPGGDPAYLAPYEALIDNDIHLTEAGYLALARRTMDEFVAEWLNYPKVFEILPLASAPGQQRFQVTFSREVTGVDPGDFTVLGVTKSGAPKAAEVISANALSSNALYEVTVNAGGLAGIIQISVDDDDSIADLNDGTNTLGGPGLGNGDFLFNGEFSFFNLPRPGNDDFYGALLFLAQSVAPYEGLIGGLSFDPMVVDLNGLIDLASLGELIDGLETGEVKIPGNGLVESYEFALIKAFLDDASLDFTARGGASHGMVKAAWEQNIAQMIQDLGGEGGLADVILPGLDTILAGFFTVGDPESSFLVQTLMGPLGLGSNDLQEQFPLNVTPPTMSNYVLLGDVLAWDADADGDGFSNAEEYVYFSIDGPAAYAEAASDPRLVPLGNREFYAVGETLRFAVMPPQSDPPAFYPHYIDSEATFQWMRNGGPVENTAFITGAQGRVLNFSALQLEDTGVYTCQWDDGESKASQVYGPLNVLVGTAVPAANVMLLLAAALTAACLGAFVLRRTQP